MDNKNMKSTKKIGGFMCHSQASTAVCMSMTTLGHRKSVIAPKRLDRTTLMMNSNLGRYSRMQLIDASPPNYQRALIKRVAPNYHKPASINPAFDHVFQVVVMRVSLHCQGCAGKVKKHLSKMEGVTSFSIDLESKRVTVMGHVSPVRVLESISKVKRAELWTC